MYIDNTVNLGNMRNADVESNVYNNLTSITENRANLSLNAILSIINTIFVCFVLIVNNILFSKDTTDLVVTPIETMLEKVKKISANPLEAAQIEEQDAFLKDEI